MKFEEIEKRIDDLAAGETEASSQGIADELIALGEHVLENWLEGHDRAPTDETREGFRLLALHRQGAKGHPSFNACRETCRELVYYHNLIRLDPEHQDVASRIKMGVLVLRHLYLFISGKMETAGLGEFCCSSRPIRANSA